MVSPGSRWHESGGISVAGADAASGSESEEADETETASAEDSQCLVR